MLVRTINLLMSQERKEVELPTSAIYSSLDSILWILPPNSIEETRPVPGAQFLIVIVRVQI